jgi:uncharacterized protein
MDTTNKIIGRKAEQAILQKALDSSKSELVALIGRRRVGKTYLILNYLEKYIKLEVVGVQNAPMPVQLAHFMSALKTARLIDTIDKSPKSWLEAFSLLQTCFQDKPKSEKVVLFFDELPWLASNKTDFIAAFDYFWNAWASKNNFMIVICGSSASWMNQKIINNKGGLHNRITQLIRIKPFTLAETMQFLVSKGINLPHYHVLQLYMALGGIPMYLDFVDKQKSVPENLTDICLKSTGFLNSEYERLLPSLFLHYQTHSAIIQALAKKRKGLTREELLAETKMHNGGSFTNYLEELIQSDFIDFYRPFGKNKKEALYRLTDMYCLFYFAYILPNKGNKTPDFMDLNHTQSFKSWAGYTFENICMTHILQIKKGLGIANISTSTASFFAKPKDGLEGTQIDLLIERSDNIIHLCEMKFISDELIMDKKMSENLLNKRTVFNYHTKNKKHIFNTFITTYGHKSNNYSQQYIDQSLKMDILFEE